MRIEITKGERDDRIVATRSDGSLAATTFPKKGPVPHDAVHWFVEHELGLSGAFWGLVAAGRNPEDIAAFATAAGHASASRAEVPEPQIVELLQAERLVECFEADLWGGGGAAADLIAVAATACDYSHVPLPELSEPDVERIREQLGKFARSWIAAPVGHLAILEWS
ncbi:MAG: hypothetical protein WBL74_14245 [Novosphingobium sp.]|uniref:hypothetical protein n=1 Tax=Novosphingobium sp. TaxID=1874826 RepID=UPI003C7A14FF